VTDKIIRVKIDAGDSAAQINQLDKSMVGLGTSADKTTAEINQLNQINTQTTKTAQAVNQALGGTSQGLAGFGRQAGQAGIQLQQFVGQVQGGVSPLVALSQQAADLGYVLGFPLLGAVVGIAAAIGGPLISSFITAGDESDKLKDKLDDLQKKIADLDSESKKAFTQVELGKLNTEYDKQLEKIQALRQESARLTDELKNASGPAQERLATQLTAVGEATRKAEKELKTIKTTIDDTSRTINESLVDGQNNAIDKTANLTQQLELQQIALKQGELAALLQAAAIQTGADSVENLDAKIKALIISNYELEQAQKAQKESQAALTAEINAEAAAWAKQSEQDQRNAERARRDQERIDQRLANMRLETQTMASETELQRGVMEGRFTEEQARLAQETAYRIMAATNEYQQLLEIDNISNEQRLAAEQSYQDRLYAINESAAQKKKQLQEYESKTRLMQMGQLGNSLMSLGQGQSKSIFETGKKLALAQAVVALPAAVMESYKNGGGYPWGLAPAAAMLATGLKNIQSIKSTSFDGGGGGASVGSAAAMSTPTLPTTPQAAPNVGAFEIRGLTQLSDQLSRLDNDEVLPVSFTKRLVASLDSVQRLQGA